MKIILNADDFGMTHEANLGIEKAMQEGYCSQTSLLQTQIILMKQ